MVTHPDGELLLTGSYDGTVTTWNIDTAQLVSRFSSHQQASGESAPVTGVGILSDATHAVSGGLDCMLRIWNLHTGGSVKTIEAHSAPIVGLVVVGAVVFSAGRDGTLHAWQMDEADPTSFQLTDSIAFPAPLDSLAANSAQLIVGDRAGDVWVLYRLPE
jgi:WD40 repeat protein